MRIPQSEQRLMQYSPFAERKNSGNDSSGNEQLWLPHFAHRWQSGSAGSGPAPQIACKQAFPSSSVSFAVISPVPYMDALSCCLTAIIDLSPLHASVHVCCRHYWDVVRSEKQMDALSRIVSWG